jgi:hypothetical protein
MTARKLLSSTVAQLCSRVEQRVCSCEGNGLDACLNCHSREQTPESIWQSASCAGAGPQMLIKCPTWPPQGALELS